MKKIWSYFDSTFPKMKMALYKKPPLEISFLSTIWVPMSEKIKCPLEMVTQVISHNGMEGLS